MLLIIEDIKEECSAWAGNIREFFRNIIKTAKLLPVIWRWKEWDWGYTERVLIKVLEEHRDHFKSPDSMTKAAEVNAQKMDTAIKLLKRVNTDFYSLAYFDKIESKWGKGITDLDLEAGTVRWNYETHPLSDKIEKEMDKEGEKALQKQERARVLVWDFIAHNSPRWWD